MDQSDQKIMTKLLADIESDYIALDQHKLEVSFEWNNQSPADMLNSVGDKLQFWGMIDQAENFYLSSIQLGDKSGLANYQLGKLYYDTGKYELAANRFEMSLKFNNEHAPTHFLAAKSYMASGNADKAYEFAISTLALNPMHQGAISIACEHYLKCLNYEKITSLIESAKPLEHLTPENRLYYALALIRIGRNLEAKEVIQELSGDSRRKNIVLWQLIRDGLTNEAQILHHEL